MDVLADVAFVAALGDAGDVGRVDVLVEQLVHGRGGTGMSLLVDLAE